MKSKSSLTLGLLLIAAAVCAQRPAMPAAVVSVGQVTETEDMETRRYTGQLVSVAVVNLVPRVSGEILQVGFQDGSYVKEGQVMYKLDPVQYQAVVKSAEAKIEECKARIEYAQKSYERNLMLYKKKAASLDTMENTQSVLRVYKATLLEAEAQLITAKDNLKNTVITAPIAGLASVTKYTRGNYITPSSGVLATIIQIDPIRIRFSISSADYLSMFGSLESMKKNGVIRLILSDGTPYKTEGSVEFLNNEVNSATDAIQIYASFPNKDGKLLVGSTVSVTLSKRKGKHLLAVTPSAVMHDSQGSFVYVVDRENTTSKRYVVLGNATPDLQMIVSGVKKGETVVTLGTHKVFPGGKIKAVKAE